MIDHLNPLRILPMAGLVIFLLVNELSQKVNSEKISNNLNVYIIYNNAYLLLIILEYIYHGVFSEIGTYHEYIGFI